MLTLKQFTDGVTVLSAFMDSDGEPKLKFFYGFGQDGGFGWHVIFDSYPGYCVIYMGDTWDKAEQFAREWEAERLADEEDDEEDA